MTAPRAARQPGTIQNAGGLKLLVAGENADPTLRIVLPGYPESDRAIEVVFPEHVTVRRHGSVDAEHLYLFRPGSQGERPTWRRAGQSLAYERELPGAVHMRARATLEEDGVRFQYKFSNRSDVAYDMIYAVTDPRLTSIFHDVRLERTYVHRADGFALLASETPNRLTMPLDQWLPCRYLASFRWPVPAQRIERRGDGITYYNASRAVDQPFIATLSTDRQWVVASFSREIGNVWSNPELTCQHVDPQAPLPPRQDATLEIKILILRGSLDDALQRAVRQRRSLKVGRLDSRGEYMSRIVDSRCALAVRNLKESTQFYMDVLGFRRDFGDGSDGWSFLSKDHFKVRLGECPDEKPAGELGNHSYFVYLTVEGLDHLHQELSARGAPVISAPEDQPWGMREFSIRTPDGHRIRFGEPIATG